MPVVHPFVESAAKTIGQHKAFVIEKFNPELGGKGTRFSELHLTIEPPEGMQVAVREYGGMETDHPDSVRGVLVGRLKGELEADLRQTEGLDKHLFVSSYQYSSNTWVAIIKAHTPDGEILLGALHDAIRRGGK